MNWFSPTELVTPFCVPKPPMDARLVLNQVNTYRGSEGLPAVVENDPTCALASIRSFESISDWSHNNFYSQAEIIESKYFYKEVVENLSTGLTELEVVPAWINSPTHKKNLDASLTYGCVRCHDENCAFIGAK